MKKAIRDASLITAIKTPYLADGSFDLESYDRLVQQQIDSGVDGIVVSGTTGEGHLMEWDEHIMLIAHTVNTFGKDLIVIGNTGSNNTREAVRGTQHGFAVGMDATLQINPYYGKTSEKGILQHFERALAFGPTFIYNVAARTGQDLQPHVIQEVAKHPNFVGVKECSGRERIDAYEKQGIACWSGNDDDSFYSRHEHGSHGVISVTSNIVPGLMRRLMDVQDAELNQRLLPLMQWLFCEPNPMGINTALAMTGAVHPVFRLPYLPLSMDQRRQGFELLKSFSNEELVGDQCQLMEDSDFLTVA